MAVRPYKGIVVSLALITGAALALGFLATPVASQGPPIPETFTNLQIFPKDISQRQLMGRMRNVTLSLGVRCSYCHVGEGNDLTQYDFSSDDKEHKKIARTMMRMVGNINNGFISQIFEDQGEDGPTPWCRSGLEMAGTGESHRLLWVTNQGHCQHQDVDLQGAEARK